MRQIYIIAAILSMLLTGIAWADIPSGRLTFTLTPAVEKTAETVNLWVPYPLSDEYQTISDMKINGNFEESGVYRDPASEAVYFHASWRKPVKNPRCVLSFHISQKNRKNTDLKASGKDYPELVQKYLEASESVPADNPLIKKSAEKAVEGKEGTLAKARAVYDWVVENTFRDPNVNACGLGMPIRTLTEAKGGGKCADLSAVFVTLARAAGIPARDVYGLRLASPKDGDVTSGFHCWAEFYLPGTGWVMVDPADVRKMMLVHDLELKDAGKWREFFWGGDDLFRVVLEKNSRSAALTGAAQPLNYFMYPAAEVDGEMLDYFDAAAFAYKVEFTRDK